jgi:hypothetical protein
MPDPVLAKVEELKALLMGEPLIGIAEREKLERGKQILRELELLLRENPRPEVPLDAERAKFYADSFEDPVIRTQLLQELGSSAPVTSSTPTASSFGTTPASAPSGFWGKVAQGVITTVLAALILYWVLPRRR